MFEVLDQVNPRRTYLSLLFCGRPSEADKMPLQPSTLHFFFSYTSASCARIRIAAHLKKIPLILHAIRTTGDSRETYPSSDPNHQVIASLTVNYTNGRQLTLTQSLTMLEYFEEVYPGEQRLLPPVTDMRPRVMARDLAHLIAGFEQGSQPLSRVSRELPDGDAGRDSWQALNISRCLDMYERTVKNSAKRYSLGDELSIADVCLVPLVQSGEYMGLQTDHWRSVDSIVAECRKIDAFREVTLQARR